MPLLYSAFGFDFRSDLVLPGVATASSQNVPAVDVRVGKTPVRIARARLRRAWHDIAPGEFLMNVRGVGRYHVHDARKIVVEPFKGAREEDVRLFLTGSAFGALLHQRGLFPLHASAVRVAEGCVAFAGPSGSGKSTVAAFLKTRGYAVLSDDVCAIATRSDGTTLAWPGFRRMRLARDVLDSLELPVASLPRTSFGSEKYEVRDTSSTPGPLPLRRIYVLGPAMARGDRHRLTALSGSERLHALIANTYRLEFVEPLGLRERHLEAAAKAAAGLSVYRLSRTLDLARASDMVELLEADFRRLATDSADAVRPSTNVPPATTR